VTDYEQREIMLNRFKRLFAELMRGQTSRNSFQPWEIELLVDFEACELPSRRRMEILRQYQRAVERQLDAGPGPPILLSHFLVIRERRRAASLRQQNPPSLDPIASGKDDPDSL
jgi:hypothetical protein